MTKRKLGYIGCSIPILLVVIVCGFLFIPEVEYLIPIGREYVNGVSGEFISALADHQERTLKSLTTPNLWPRIDDWLANHKEIGCNGPLWWEPVDVSPWERTIIIEKPDYRQETLVLSRSCPDDANLYCLKIEEISLHKTEDGWLIEDWEEIQEGQDQFGLCSFQP